MAFFTAEELKEAGYTFRELIAARFSRNELVEAGFDEDLNKRQRNTLKQFASFTGKVMSRCLRRIR